MNFNICTSIAYPLTQDKKQRFTYQRKEYVQLVKLEEELAKTYKANRVLLVNSGMEAITTLFDLVLDNDDTIIINRNLYAETQLWLKAINRYKVVMYDFQNLDTLEAVIKENKPKLIHLDNPNIYQEWFDIKKIVKIAHAYGVKVSIDNSIVSFYYYNPIKDEADYVTESYSKYVAGHGDCMAGALVFREKPIGKNRVRFIDFIEWRGRCVNPLQVYNVERGLETLSLRMDRITESARYIVEKLSEKGVVLKYARVGGNIVIPYNNPLSICKKVKHFIPLTAYGATFSIVTPSRRADSYQDVCDYIRFSIGLEEADILLEDICDSMGIL